MPIIELLVQVVSRAKFISCVDYCRGYNQICVSPESIPFTAFVTPFGKYVCLKMPFGLVSASCTCQRLSDWICDGCESFARCYLDDLVVFSDSWSDHLQHLEMILQRVSDAAITLKPSKCCFASGQVNYLGYVVGSGSVRPDELKVSAFREFARPGTKSEVK